jgi:mono/diheme cytochrome c family protein
MGKTSVMATVAACGVLAVVGACGKGGGSGDGSGASAPAPTKTAVSSEAVAGRKLFITTCAPCHGETGKGDGAQAATLAVKPRNLAAEHFKYIQFAEGTPREDAVVAFLKVGNPETGMAPYGAQYSDQELKQLAAYILMIHKVEEPTAGG